MQLVSKISSNTTFPFYSLQWRHNDHDGVSNHQPHGCLLNRLFRRRSKKTSKLCVTGLCVGKSPGPVNSPHKVPVTRKMFPFDDVIMWTYPIQEQSETATYARRLRVKNELLCAYLINIKSISKTLFEISFNGAFLMHETCKCVKNWQTQTFVTIAKPGPNVNYYVKCSYPGHFLLTWFNFNPSIDK